MLHVLFYETEGFNRGFFWAFEDEFKRVLLDGADLRTSLARIDTAWNELLDAAPPAGLECVPRPSRVEAPAAFVNPGGAA